MRTRPRTSLLLATLLTTAICACAARSPDPADPSSVASLAGGGAPASSGGPSLASSSPSASSPPASSDAANPPDASAHSSGDAPAAALEARRAERFDFVTGVALTSAGALAALMGGVFLGRSGAFCHSYGDTCGSSIALPITGALWIGAGVVPLVLGVTILVPRVGAEPAPPPPASGAGTERAQLFVGPAGVGARVPF